MNEFERRLGEKRLLEQINDLKKSQDIAKEEYEDIKWEGEEMMRENKIDKKDIITKEYLINGGNYFPNLVAQRSEALPSGVYECAITREGVPYFRPITIMTDVIVDLPDTAMVDISNEIRNFWSKGVSEKFKQYGLVHKRGVLLEGPPGSGKTITLAKTANMVVNELGGIVLFNPSVASLTEYLRLIKEIEPNKKILVMWEEFDSLLGNAESEILSLLDGETQVDNIVYLATTNYISRIPARIKNRPSRFARVVTVGIPSVETREAYFRAKLHESDLDKLPGLLQYSDGYVIDQLKDLIISHCIFGQGVAEAAKKINEMIEESTGMDDYNEEAAKSVFKHAVDKSRPSSPLQPIR
jgi:ATPase family associated with various cellular activities (AAA)